MRFTVWDKVYGFNMSCIKDIALREPLVDTVDQNMILSNSVAILVRSFIYLINQFM